MSLTDIKHHHLINRKNKILEELWDLTQNYLDDHIHEDRTELELLMELEETNEFKSLLKDLNTTKDNLNELYVEFLDKECKSSFKKDKIIVLKKKFQENISNAEIVLVVNCSRSYARQFYIINGKVDQKERRSSLSAKTKKEVLKRDNYLCIACGYKEDLEIHHIIPVTVSWTVNTDNIDNLATLCKKCHYLAHNGNYYKELAYESVEDFWKWTQNTDKTKMWLFLKDVHGVGLKIVEHIYYNFSSMEELEKASVRNLAKVPYVNRSLAERIKFKLKTGLNK